MVRYQEGLLGCGLTPQPANDTTKLRLDFRPGSPLSLNDTWHLVQAYVEHYNNIRLNSAVG